ncbi:hypothetical protein I4U23_026769 [Adineta vaga]|nr:hypothetical protein I4U23_026769 [Adineta vaga]
MTKRRKFRQQLPSLPSTSSIDDNRKQFLRKHRRRRRRRRRRLKRQIRSLTKITTNAFNMLQISTDSATVPLEFIERNQLTRYHALQMPLKQRPIVFLIDQINSSIISEQDDLLSSYV